MTYSVRSTLGRDLRVGDVVLNPNTDEDLVIVRIDSVRSQWLVLTFADDRSVEIHIGDHVDVVTEA